MIDLSMLWFYLQTITTNHKKLLQLIVGCSFIFGTTTLLSPQIAAQSPIPWLLFFSGNVLWALESLLLGSYAYFFTGTIFTLYDLILIYSRIVGINEISWNTSFVSMMNNYLL
jgi:hypothetical protein